MQTSGLHSQFLSPLFCGGNRVVLEGFVKESEAPKVFSPDLTLFTYE